MNAYKLTLGTGKDKTTLSFRLTLGSQKALKQKYDQTALATMLDAIDDAEILAEVMTEALNYRGNENAITDGEEVYDLLVDNGYAGVGKFTELIMGIAQASGLVDASQADKMVKKAQGMIDQALDDIDEAPKNQ